MKRLLAFLLALVSAFGCFMTGCVGGDENDPTALIIECHKAGYGFTWITNLAQQYQAKTGKKVVVIPQQGVQGVANMTAHIESLTSETDLFFSTGASFKDPYVGEIVIDGVKYDCLYEDMSDLYETEIPGENVTVAEKMNSESRDYLKFVNADNNNSTHYYHFPYVAGMQGFIRNNEVWQDDWTLPRTTDELIELCDTIIEYHKAQKAQNKNIKELAPFIYSLSEEYWTSMLSTFVSQYEGKVRMNRYYNGYGVGSRRYTTDMIALPGLQEALEFFHTLLKSEKAADGKTIVKDYMHSKSQGLSFSDMQSMFLSGSAVFNCNGDWLEQEMVNSYGKGKDIEMIKLPVLSACADKCSFKDLPNAEQILRDLIDYVDGVTTTQPENTTPADVTYITEARSFERMGAGNCAYIPCYSNQKESAKDFLLFLASNDGLKIFSEQTSGCQAPFDYSGVEISGESTKFRQSVNAIMARSSDGSSKTKDKIFSLGGLNVDFWNNGKRFVSAFAAKNEVAGGGYKTAQTYYTDEIAAFNKNLANAKIKAGLV